MKSLKSIPFLLLTLIITHIFLGCENTDNSDNFNRIKSSGALSIKTSLTEEIDINLTAKDYTFEEILKETLVTIKDSGGKEVLSELYPELPNLIELPVGDYNFFMIRQGDSKPNFDNPTYITPQYYFSGEHFIISENAHTEVDGTMFLDHIKVVVEFSDEVLQAFPDIIADVFDPNPVDSTPEAQKLRWSALESGKSGYIYIDTHDTELKLEISATNQNLNQTQSVTKTFFFQELAFNQKFHFLIKLNEQKAPNGSLSIDLDFLPEELHEKVIQFPIGETVCKESSKSDYEILKKLSEANLDAELGTPILPWDLTDSSMLSWNGVALNSEGRVIEINLSTSDGALIFVPEFWQLCKLQTFISDGFDLSLPPGIGQLSNLEYLEVKESKMRELPSEIGMLKKLKELSISQGQFYVLPPEIGQLESLERLQLFSLFVEVIPPELGQLNNLKHLIIFNNNSSGLIIPPEIGNLKNLEVLDLNASVVNSIPEELGQLTNLNFMDLRANPVINIPQAVCDLDDVDTEILLDDGNGGHPADICN